MRKLLFTFITLVAFTNCEREGEYRRSFPFEVDADFQKETFVNTPIESDFDLTPEHVVTTNVYSVSYRVMEGKGSVILENGEELNEREIHELEGLFFKSMFLPKSTGTITVEYTFADQEGETTIKTVDYSVSDTSFYFNATGSLATLTLSKRLQINYSIKEQGTTDVDEYTLVFSSSQNGTMTVNSRDYKAGEKITVPSLDFIAFYTPSVPGEHIITSNITAKTTDVTLSNSIGVAVEPSDFEFNVSVLNEITVGDNIELNFVIDEVVGDSNFDISYAFTGVNAEFRNANNVVLQPNQNYDVDNTFAWTLKGIEQGTMEITFTVKNQFGIEKTKTIPIEVKPIDFDFSVELLDNILTLERGIRLRFHMNAPDVLDYNLSFNANTGGIIDVNNQDLEKDQSVQVSSTNFDAIYYASLSGNSVINFTITASNGVTKTKSMNFDITQKPKVTGVFDYSEPCGMVTVPRQRFRIAWTKDDRETIVSAEIQLIGNGTNVTRRKTFNPPITGGTHFDQEFYTGCTSPPNAIRVKIIDSRGQQSEVFTVNY